MDSFLAEYHKDKLKNYKEQNCDSHEEFVNDARFIAANISPHDLDVVRNRGPFDKTVREFDLADNSFNSKMEFSQILYKYLSNIDSAHEHGLSFLFYGFNESGKTIEAVRILVTALLKGYNGYYIDFRNLMNLHNDAVYNSEEDKREVLNFLLSCDFLVVDELGKESSVTENVIGSLERIVKTRASRNLSTIIVTNIQVHDKFKDRYGNSVYSAMIRKFRAFNFSKKGQFRKKTQVDWDDVL